jgi:hypothetical protein
MSKATKSTHFVYQLKITLRGIRPPIWRRVLVPGKFNLNKLHDVIQIAMGWTDSHLHQFIINGEPYGVPDADDWEPVRDERRYSLIKIAPQEKSKFSYEYDFGDSWQHIILVEKILAPEAGVKYPVCIKGKRACPPEDVGGIWGYEEFLEAIRDPKHEEYDSYLEWLGEEFDPERCDLEEINEELGTVR